MADARNVRQDEDGPPYPTFNERRYENEKAPIFLGAYERLVWPIRGEFPSAIAVMTEPHHNTSTPEPFFNPDTREWHEIASQSITNTKVSYLKASLLNLDSWDRNWERKHIEHADPAYDECEFVTYGDLNNDVRPFAEEPERQDGTWSWDEPSDTEILVRCCGEDRPLGRRGLSLEVRPSPGNDFVTVKDYVSAVHPWLISMQDDILAAMRIAEPGYPASTEWRLSNSYYDGPRHQIILPELWESMNQPNQNTWVEGGNGWSGTTPANTRCAALACEGPRLPFLPIVKAEQNWQGLSHGVLRTQMAAAADTVHGQGTWDNPTGQRAVIHFRFATNNAANGIAARVYVVDQQATATVLQATYRLPERNAQWR